jgi:penicillin-binding protein 2
MDFLRCMCVAASVLVAAGSASGITTVNPAHPVHPRVHTKVVSGHVHHAKVVHAAGVAASRQTISTLHPAKYTATPAAILRSSTKNGRYAHVYSPWTEPTFADSTIGDKLEGEDLAVRKAAVDALGPYNGSVVVADALTGRILSTVNQELAATGAYQPCSTIKVVVSLAALSEKVIDPDAHVLVTRHGTMSLTQALAKSNNNYFAKLGEQLGFERVVHYGKLFGLGEKAAYDLDGEQAGVLPDTVPDSGIGMMTSFGDGIRLTPLELAGIVTSIANGGTLYYLQRPKSLEDAQNFVPRVKRYLDISQLIPQIRPGMMGAVEYGTARRASNAMRNISLDSDALAGKTGTCTDTVHPGVHLGWFGSFTEVGNAKLVVVVLLTGGRGVSGPIASGIAGNVYRNLSQANYFSTERPLPTLNTLPIKFSPLNLVPGQACCH